MELDKEMMRITRHEIYGSLHENVLLRFHMYMLCRFY